LSTFDRVKILARVHETPTHHDSWLRVDGEGVSFLPVPGYIGPWEFARNFRRVGAAIRTAISGDSAVLLVVPGMIGTVALRCLRPGQPYGVEVIGDPFGHFSKPSISHPLRPLFRWWFTHDLKRQCRKAACSLYVTERALQQRYPPNDDGFSVGVSDVEMQDVAFIDPAATSSDEVKANRSGRFCIAFVGGLESRVKAPDILLTAFSQSVSTGLDAELAMIGDGRERPQVERLAQTLGIGDRVKFLGRLSSGAAVRQQLDACDLFVLASWSEGLPRAMIEAMARGLACIGSRVGGIPELLPDIAMVQPGDSVGLAAKILELARDPQLRRDLGRMNLETARRYHESLLQPKRVAFYERLREVTRAWQRAGASRNQPGPP